MPTKNEMIEFIDNLIIACKNQAENDALTEHYFSMLKELDILRTIRSIVEQWEGEDDKTDFLKLGYLQQKKARKKFISYEPLLSENVIRGASFVDWVIIGRLTGEDSGDFKPSKQAVEKLVYSYKRNKIPIFLKDNLRSVWGSELIQEMPE